MTYSTDIYTHAEDRTCSYCNLGREDNQRQPRLNVRHGGVNKKGCSDVRRRAQSGKFSSYNAEKQGNLGPRVCHLYFNEMQEGNGADETTNAAIRVSSNDLVRCCC